MDRVSGEKQALLQENRNLEGDKDNLRHKLRQTTEENVKIKERWVHVIRDSAMYSDVELAQGKILYVKKSNKPATGKNIPSQ